MKTVRRILINLTIVACMVQATNTGANNKGFRAAETRWSRWIPIAGSRAGGVDYSHKDEKGLSCVRFRNRFSYPVHIDCLVTIAQGGRTRDENVGWLLKKGVSGSELANDCFQGDFIISVKVKKTAKG